MSHTKGQRCVIAVDSYSTGMQNNITDKFQGLLSYSFERIGKRLFSSFFVKASASVQNVL